jgi:Flp pilus assembly protein TadD
MWCFLPSRPSIFIATSALAAAALPAATEAPAWRLLRTPRFTVVSQLSDDETRAWAGGFGRFVSALGAVVPVDERTLAPLTIVLFAEDRSFEPYKPMGARGKRANEVSGCFASRDTWSVIAMAVRSEDAETRQTMFHEGVHWFTNGHGEERPVWFEEGLADAFSTLRFDDSGAVWGEVPAAYVEFMESGEPVPPLEEVLARGRRAAAFDEEKQAAGFYVRAWAFVHREMFDADGDGGASLARFVEALRSGERTGDAFRRVFGCAPDEMDRRIDACVRERRFRCARRPAPSACRMAATVIVEAPEAAVEAALGRLALGAENFELAQRHLARVVELGPDRPEGYELFTVLAADCGDGEAVLAASGRALGLGSRDAGVSFLRAQERFRMAGERGEILGQEAREIADLLERALTEQPHLPLAYRSLSRVLCSVDELTEADVRMVEQGRRLYPADGEIVFGLAVMAAQRGEREVAVQLLRHLVRAGMEMSEEAREASRALARALMQPELAVQATAGPAA